MNRAPSLAFRVAIAAIFLLSGTSRIKAQESSRTSEKCCVFRSNQLRTSL